MDRVQSVQLDLVAGTGFIRTEEKTVSLDPGCWPVMDQEQELAFYTGYLVALQESLMGLPVEVSFQQLADRLQSSGSAKKIIRKNSK